MSVDTQRSTVERIANGVQQYAEYRLEVDPLWTNESLESAPAMLRALLTEREAAEQNLRSTLESLAAADMRAIHAEVAQRAAEQQVATLEARVKELEAQRDGRNAPYEYPDHDGRQ